MSFPIAGSLHCVKNHLPPRTQSRMACSSLTRPVIQVCCCPALMGSVQPLRSSPMLPFSERRLLPSLPGLPSLGEPGRSDLFHMSAGAKWWPHQQPRIIGAALLSVTIRKGKQKAILKSILCSSSTQRISWKSFIFKWHYNVWFVLFYHFYHFLAEAQVAWLG